MDGWRTDPIARFLDALQTRRTALGGTVGGLLVLADAARSELVDAGKKRKKRKKRCGKKKTRCKGVCVNTNKDPLNCGGCGQKCDPNEQCRNGVCGCDVCDNARECPYQSVQAAIDAANAGATITICKGSFDGAIVVSKNLTLVGNGADDTELDGNGEGSTVTIAEGVTATISGVTISGGTGTLVPAEGFIEGGGILNRGTLAVLDSVITDNEAERGGGILNLDERDLILDNTVVKNNKVATDKPAGTFGGGILNLFGGHLTVQNGSAIENNKGGNSAGIHNNGTLVMSDSTVENNDAEFDGAGIINDEGEATLNNSIVRGNTTKQGRGGGILNLGFTLIIENGSQITDNTAATSGGGIFNQGIGILQVTDSAITENTASEDGGGLFNISGNVTLTRATVSDNAAGSRGGGAFNSGPVLPHAPASLTLENSVIEENRADLGGGILDENEGVVTLDTQSRVVDNIPDNCIGTGACNP
ncbi:MAG: hypothetical protein U0031_06855 [Thermomicrobiales bacterium]